MSCSRFRRSRCSSCPTPAWWRATTRGGGPSTNAALAPRACDKDGGGVSATGAAVRAKPPNTPCPALETAHLISHIINTHQGGSWASLMLSATDRSIAKMQKYYSFPGQ